MKNCRVFYSYQISIRGGEKVEKGRYVKNEGYLVKELNFFRATGCIPLVIIPHLEDGWIGESGSAH